MINRAHPTISNFTGQLLFLCMVYYLIKCPEFSLSVMSPCQWVGIPWQSLVYASSARSDEAHVKWHQRGGQKQNKEPLILFFFPRRCSLSVLPNSSSNCFCIGTKWDRIRSEASGAMSWHSLHIPPSPAGLSMPSRCWLTIWASSRALSPAGIMITFFAQLTLLHQTPDAFSQVTKLTSHPFLAH